MKPKSRKHKKYLKLKTQFFETENPRGQNRIYQILKTKTHGPTVASIVAKHGTLLQ